MCVGLCVLREGCGRCKRRRARPKKWHEIVERKGAVWLLSYFTTHGRRNRRTATYATRTGSSKAVAETCTAVAIRNRLSPSPVEMRISGTLPTVHKVTMQRSRATSGRGEGRGSGKGERRICYQLKQFHPLSRGIEDC